MLANAERCWEHQTWNLSVSKTWVILTRVKHCKGTKALCQGEAEGCVSLVFKITIASKRTACYSFSIIHIFLAFINTRGQGVLATHLRATAEVGTPPDIRESTECPFEAWAKLPVTWSNVARTEPFYFCEVLQCCPDGRTPYLRSGHRAKGTFQSQIYRGNMLISGSDIPDVFLYNFPWVIS